MSDLFNSKGAHFSEDRKYRFALYRVWDTCKPMVMFIGLNPSTANEQTNDKTITRVISFAMAWGYGGVYMMNLFALVSKEPDVLRSSANPVGDNDQWLLEIAAKCDKVIFAWGRFPIAKERSKIVREMFPQGYCLAILKDGSPQHPLMVPKTALPIVYQCK